jgi:hypothetical protein
MHRTDSYSYRYTDSENSTSAYLLSAERNAEAEADVEPETPCLYPVLRNLLGKLSFTRSPTAPESNYLTLIPLSGARPLLHLPHTPRL